MTKGVDGKGGKGGDDNGTNAQIEKLMLSFALLFMATSPAGGSIDGIVNDELDLPVGLNTMEGLLAASVAIGE